MKCSKINSGFTLIELIIYVALISSFLTGAVIFAWGVLQTQGKARAQQEVIYASRMATRRIMYEIRNASSINSVGAQSISLANADTAKNPTVIDVTSGRVRIGYGNTGSCPTSSPCFLTPSDLVVQSLVFANMSDAGNKSANIKFELVLKSAPSDIPDWFYKQYATGSAEVRSKN